VTTKDALQQRLECAKLVEEFSVVGKYLRLQTRLLYPDGSNIDVFLSPEPSRLQMSDLGNTMTWLSHLGIRPWQTLRRNEQVDEMLRGLGVELDGGELIPSVLPGEHESIAMIRVAQACTRLADLYLTKRRQVAQFREDVEEAVSAFDLPYTVDAQLLGRSGERVSVDMLVHGKQSDLAP
jgi:hypothetical protein